jgi:5-methylcytosine-specific restriction endonuclease McrBC regulatory subunit McrC
MAANYSFFVKKIIEDIHEEERKRQKHIEDKCTKWLEKWLLKEQKQISPVSPGNCEYILKKFKIYKYIEKLHDENRYKIVIPEN